MIDYYDPSPRIRLARSIVIAGQLGCGARMIGRTLSARTGLPFAEVDRLIEHEAGRSLREIAAEEGTKRIEALARTVLERRALERPFGLIVVDRAWPAAESRRLLRRRLDFVHVKRPARFLFERLTRRLGPAEGWLLGELAGNLRDESDLEPLFAQRTPLLAEAQILLDAGSRHEMRVAQLLAGSLEAVSGAQTL